MCGSWAPILRAGPQAKIPRGLGVGGARAAEWCRIQGVSGTLSGNAGTQGTQGSSLRLNYQEGRLTFFGGGSVSR